MLITVIVIGIILLIITLFLFFQLSKIKRQKENFQSKEREWELKHESLQKLNQDLVSAQERTISLEKECKKLRNEIDEEIENKRINIENLYNSLKTSSSQAFSNYEHELDKAYKNKEVEIANQINKIKKEKEQQERQKDQLTTELTQLKGIFRAATAAHLRQQEEQQKILFYKIQLTDQQCSDINYLLTWKEKLYDPTIVSKIIWSAYVLKPTSDLCNRVLGTKAVCGVYKITNKSTGEVYIGQSVNVADRWKAHIKCGLGIDASSTNKLYNNMQQSMVWNFTFELLQKCSREKLNEKERFWINMYQSDKVGLNITRGNK